MRIRSTKPEFWRSKTIAAIPWESRLVLKGLEHYVDDNGVGKDDLALIAGDVFPRDLVAKPRDTLARLSAAISTLSEAGLIVRYDIEGEDLLYIDDWKRIQRVDKPAKGRFPRPDGTFEYDEEVDKASFATPSGTLASPRDTLAPVTGEQRNRGTEEQGAKPPRAPRSPDTSSDDPDFAAFWSAYPRKIDRGHALKAWAKATKAADPADITRAAKAFAEANRDTEPKFIPHPATWLNGERWTDEAPPTGLRSANKYDRQAADPSNAWMHQ